MLVAIIMPRNIKKIDSYQTFNRKNIYAYISMIFLKTALKASTAEKSQVLIIGSKEFLVKRQNYYVELLATMVKNYSIAKKINTNPSQLSINMNARYKIIIRYVFYRVLLDPSSKSWQDNLKIIATIPKISITF